MTDHSESRLWTRSALPTQPLPDSDIHVWCASLNVSSQDLSYYSSLLSEDEVARTGRFYFEKDRDRFIVGRGLLRILLGGYLNQEPAQIEFVYGPHGKPDLKSAPGKSSLEFNLSHSKDLALYAFAWHRKVGIDIEYMIPMADMDDFAEKFFTPHETALINSLAGKQKEETFFKTWTCKEAFLKANGFGLTVPINQVELTLEPEETVRLISVGSDKEQSAHWRLEMFNPFPGYQSALAVKGLDRHIVFHQLAN